MAGFALIGGSVTAAFVLLEGLLSLFERGLGLRRWRHLAGASSLLAIAFVLPDLVAGNPMAPTQQMSLPGLAEGPDTPHGVLNDIYVQFLPWEVEVRRLYGEAGLPLWSDRLAGGFPLWSNPQAQPVSPIAWFARLGPLGIFLPLTLALKIATAFRGTSWLARALGASRFAALVGAASFAWGGGLMGWGLWPHGSTLAFLPWLLLATVRLVRRPGRIRLATTAGISAVVLLSGYPVMAVLGGLLAAVCAFFFAKRGQRIRALAAAALAATLGFGLAAVHILPFAETLEASHRTQEVDFYLSKRHDRGLLPGEWLRLESHFSRPKHLEIPFHPAALGKPYAEGSGSRKPLLVSAYSGLVALLGTFLALLARRRSSWPFLLYLLPGWAIFGGWLPLDPWNGATPESYFRLLFNYRFVPILGLSAAVVAAIGWSRPKRGSLLVGFAVAAVSLAIRATALVLGLWVVLLSALVWRGHPRIRQALLLLVLVADLLPWSRALLPQGDPERLYPPTEPLTRAIALCEDGRWRATGHGYEAYPNLLAVYGLADIRYHDPLEAASYRQALTVLGFHDDDRFHDFSAMYGTAHPLLDFLNVRAVFAQRDHPIPSGRFRTLAEDEEAGWRLLENPRPLPRFFLTSEVQVVPAENEVAALRDLEDPVRVVLRLEEIEKGDWAPAALPNPYVALTPEDLGIGHVRLEVPGRKTRLLATSLKDPRGWSVSSGEDSLRKVTVNHAFLGVIVPPDIDEIELLYRPPGFRLGATLGLLSLAILGLVALPWRGRSASR